MRESTAWVLYSVAAIFSTHVSWYIVETECVQISVNMLKSILPHLYMNECLMVKLRN